jgi:uncharacterized protein (TIGR02284 family)
MDNEHVVNILNDLIETCKDGEYGFDTCAQHAATPETQQLFSQRAGQCREAAQELRSLVLQHHGAPDDGGSATGALHRGWVAVIGTVAGASDKRMLEEAERGEDAALARYRKALREEGLPVEVRSVIERQMAGVQHNHDQIKVLRDQARAVS